MRVTDVSQLYDYWSQSARSHELGNEAPTSTNRPPGSSGTGREPQNFLREELPNATVRERRIERILIKLLS